MKLYMVIVSGEHADGELFDKIFFKSKYEDAIEICDLADRCAFGYNLYKYISRTRQYKSIMRGNTMRARFAVLVRDTFFGVHPIRYFNTYKSLTEYLDRLDAFNRSSEDVKYNWLAYRYDSKLKNYVYIGGF